MGSSLLEKRLEQLEPRLRADLSAITREVHRAWDMFGENVWFADHSVAHSERVIDMIEQILVPFLPDGSRCDPSRSILLSDASPVRPLTAHELYVLLAACYLHTISLPFTFHLSKLDTLSVDGYHDILRYYPRLSYEVILKSAAGVETGQPTSLGLRNDMYLRLIALIVKATNAGTFEDAVREFQENYPDPKGFRGELLAALLLMGNQLDVTRKRARFSNAMANNAASLLHNHTYSYIRDVRILHESNPMARKIKIWFEFPSHKDWEDRQYEAGIRSWVIGTLKLPCKRAQSTFSEFAGGLTWDSEVEEVIAGPSQNLRSMPGNAIALLHEFQYEQRTVDRIALKQALKGLLRSGHGGCIAIRCPEYSDQRFLIEWFEAVCQRYDKVTPVRLTFEPGRSDDREGILERIALGLDPELFHDFWLEQKRLDREAKLWSARLPDLVSVFLERFKAVCARTQPVLVLENVHLLETKGKDWLRRKILEPIQGKDVARRPLIVLLLSGQGDELLCASPDENCFTLHPFTADEVKEHLRRVLGYSNEGASVEAQRIVTETGGLPSLVLGEVDQKWMEYTQLWKILELPSSILP